MHTIFAGGSEASSICGGVVQLHGCDEIIETTTPTTLDEAMMPLYSSRVPKDISEAVSHQATVQRWMPSALNTPDHAERYLVASVATWAYTRCLLTTKYLNERNVIVPFFAQDNAAAEYFSPFSLRRFVETYARHPWYDVRHVQITRTVAADAIARAMTIELKTTVARIVCSSLRQPQFDDEDPELYGRLRETVRCFDVFPNRFLTQDADLHHSVLVKHDDRQQVTIASARDLMRQESKARRAKLKRKAGRRGGRGGGARKRQRIVSSTVSSSPSKSSSQPPPQRPPSSSSSSSPSSPSLPSSPSSPLSQSSESPPE